MRTAKNAAEKKIEQACFSTQLLSEKYGVPATSIVWKGDDCFIICKDGEQIETNMREYYAEIVVDSMEKLVKNPERLEGFEKCLSRRPPTWTRKYALPPDSLVNEMKMFANTVVA